MKCANCSNEAVYTVTYQSARPVNYCETCIPKHMRKRAWDGEFPLQTGSSKKAKKKVSAPSEEPVEETTAEEPVDEDI